MTPNQPEYTAGSRSLSRGTRLALIIAVWIATIGGFFIYQRSTGNGPTDAAQRLVDAARGTWWAAIAYIALSVVRPLLLFPATLLTVAAGMMFGPVTAIVVAVIGANLSALVGHTVGRIIGPRSVGDNQSTINTWSERLRANSFETVLLMRLIFLPYDAVNYGCGWLAIQRRPFLIATALGSLPGTIGFVLAGRSITDLRAGVGAIRPVTLIWSIAIIVTSLIVARVLKRTTRRSTEHSTG
jgi:uncharacterized membrane protein YdjX (TVP38/TMEM64 family)